MGLIDTVEEVWRGVSSAEDPQIRTRMLSRAEGGMGATCPSNKPTTQLAPPSVTHRISNLDII